jgi:hypothetical protein
MLFGLPFEMGSDQGPEFTNDVLKRLNERMTIAHKVTTPYYPQANGAVERFNQTFKSSCAIFCDKHPKNWDWHTTSLVFAYNSSLSPVTGFTPFFLMFGREPRLPIDILHSSVKDLKHDVEQYQLEMTIHLHNAYNIVRQKLKDYAVQTKKVWDSKVKPYDVFQENDLVAMYRPTENKLTGTIDHSQVWIADWVGPLRVIKIPYPENPDVYIVKELTTNREFTVNAHKLKPYISREYLTSLDTELLNAPTNQDMSLDGESFQDRSRDAGTLTEVGIDPIRNPRLARPASLVDPVTTRTKRKQHRHETGFTRQEQLKRSKRSNDNDKLALSDLDKKKKNI